VPYRIIWSLDKAGTPPEEDGRFYHAKSLRDVPGIVRRWG
jgi:hypothetical protein